MRVRLHLRQIRVLSVLVDEVDGAVCGGRVHGPARLGARGAGWAARGCMTRVAARFAIWRCRVGW